jgi:hypothetical protein
MQYVFSNASPGLTVRFLGVNIGIFERGGQDLSNCANVVSKLANFLFCLHIYSLRPSSCCWGDIQPDEKKIYIYLRCYKAKFYCIVYRATRMCRCWSIFFVSLTLSDESETCLILSCFIHINNVWICLDTVKRVPSV